LMPVFVMAYSFGTRSSKPPVKAVEAVTLHVRGLVGSSAVGHVVEL